MSPDFLFHPVLDKRKAPTGVPYRKVVHPAPQDRIDQFDHLTHRLALVPPEDLPEFRISRTCSETSRFSGVSIDLGRATNQNGTSPNGATPHVGRMYPTSVLRKPILSSRF